MRIAHVLTSRTSTVDSCVPTHTAPNVAGTKTIVCSQSGGASQRFTSPITTASVRYSIDAIATAPPWLNDVSRPRSSGSPATNVVAVRSVNATITYTSATQMNVSIAT